MIVINRQVEVAIFYQIKLIIYTQVNSVEFFSSLNRSVQDNYAKLKWEDIQCCDFNSSFKFFKTDTILIGSDFTG